MRAFQIAAVVIGWQLYSMTKSPFALGLVGLCQFLPMLALTLPAGTSPTVTTAPWSPVSASGSRGGDAGPRRRLGNGHDHPGDGVRGRRHPRRHADHRDGGNRGAAPPDRRAHPAAACRDLATSAMETALVVGPAIGGVIYLAGAPIAYASVAALYAAAGCLIWSLKPIESGGPDRTPPNLASFLSGVRFVRANPSSSGPCRSISSPCSSAERRAAADLCPGHSVRRFDRPRRLARGPGRRRASDVARHRPPPDRAPDRPGGARRRRGVRCRDDRVRPLDLVSALARGAGGDGRGRRHQRRDPLDRGADGNAGSDARTVNAINFLFIGASNQLGEFESGLTAAFLGAVPAVVVGGIARSRSSSSGL